MCLSHVLTNWSGPLFIWHRSEVGMTLHHTYSRSFQVKREGYTSTAGTGHKHTTTYFRTMWNQSWVTPARPAHWSLFRCCLRQSNMSFSHSFMDSYFMYLHSRSVIQEVWVLLKCSLPPVCLSCTTVFSTLPLTVLSSLQPSCHTTVFQKISPSATLQCLPFDPLLVTPFCSPPSKHLALML